MNKAERFKRWKSVMLGVCGALLAGAAMAEKQPNIILIMADDMGWGDVGYHGFDDIMTPNIDRIAKEGVQFTQGYVTASVCGPSRAGLLTGVYQQKFGCGENPTASGYPDKMKYPMAGVPRSQPMISEMLKEQGYTTGMVGKWHLGVNDSLRPHARGFDFYYGFLNGSHSYEEWTNEFAKNKSRWPIFRNNEMEPPQKDIYLTDLFSDEAVGFIDRNHEKPFFLFMSYNAIHHPWQVPEKYAERTKDLTDSENRNFIAAMILAMDDGIGRVYQVLEKHDILDDTAIIFLSDNGTPRGQGLKHFPKNSMQERQEGSDYMSCSAGLRGYKGDTCEGGTRVPFCMRWPGKIKPGTMYERPVSALDIVPTFVKDVKSDGVDLLPYLQGTKTGRPHDVMYWRRDNDYAIRKGDWKLTWNDASGSPTIKLFNLANDPKEKYDLAKIQPERAQMLQDLFDEWDNQLPDNEWWGGPWNRKRHRGKVDVAGFNANLPKPNQLRRKIRTEPAPKTVQPKPGAKGLTLK
jgi:arylsulfatase A-like enzyme